MDWSSDWRCRLSWSFLELRFLATLFQYLSLIWTQIFLFWTCQTEMVVWCGSSLYQTPPPHHHWSVQSSLQWYSFLFAPRLELSCPNKILCTLYNVKCWWKIIYVTKFFSNLSLKFGWSSPHVQLSCSWYILISSDPEAVKNKQQLLILQTIVSRRKILSIPRLHAILTCSGKNRRSKQRRVKFTNTFFKMITTMSAIFPLFLQKYKL